MSENDENPVTEKTTTQGTGGKGPSIMPMVVAAIVVLAAVGGILAFNNYNKPNIEPGTVNVTLLVDFGNGTVEWHNVSTTNNSISGVMVEAFGSHDLDFNNSIEGIKYLESVRGIKNNCTIDGLSDSSNRWWRYSINGTLAPLTNLTFNEKASLGPVKDKQQIELQFMISDGPSGILDKSGISLTVRINFGNGTIKEKVVTTENFTALGALESMVGYENLDMTDWGAWGVLVDGIEGVSTGSVVEGINDTSNYYWFWYINDGFAYVGASQYVLQDGDVMEWRFEESAW